ncbi:MAG: flagellar protein FlaG [Treponemataceae bacterium]
MTISMNLVGQQMTTDGHAQKRVAPQRVVGSAQEAKSTVLAKKDADALENQLQILKNSPLFQDKKIHYSINDELDQVIIKIIDSKTDKIIEEIPSVDMQKFLVTFANQNGLLVNEKA